MGHNNYDCFGTGMAGPPNQEKQKHNGLGSYTQLAVGLDRNWMVDCAVPGRQEIMPTTTNNPTPPEIKFYEIIGSGRCFAVYKWYIKNADRDKNP